VYDDEIHIKLTSALYFYMNSVIVCIFLKLSLDDGLSGPKHVVSGVIKIFVRGEGNPPIFIWNFIKPNCIKHGGTGSK
jgi:hypothetical protein